MFSQDNIRKLLFWKFKKFNSGWKSSIYFVHKFCFQNTLT